MADMTQLDRLADGIRLLYAGMVEGEAVMSGEAISGTPTWEQCDETVRDTWRTVAEYTDAAVGLAIDRAVDQDGDQ